MYKLPATRVECYHPGKFHTMRLTGIGASDIAAIMGVSKYASKLDVYMDKTGQRTVEENAAMRWGILKEPLIRDEFAKLTGLDIFHSTPKSNILVRDKEMAYFYCHPDGLIVAKNNGHYDAGLEVKTAGQFMADKWGEPGSDDVPEDYLLQCQWSMMCTGLDLWHLAVLIGSSDFRTYQIARNQKLVEKMESAGYQFWNDHVLPQCPPNPGPGDSDTASLKALYPSQVKPEEKIEPTATISELVAERFTLLPRMKKLKSRKQEIENLVRDHMKLKAFMEGDDWKAVWRQNNDGNKVDYASVAEQLAEDYNVPTDVFVMAIARNTTTKKGDRPLRITQAKGK